MMTEKGWKNDLPGCAKIICKLFAVDLKYKTPLFKFNPREETKQRHNLFEDTTVRLLKSERKQIIAPGVVQSAGESPHRLWWR